ncbi:MAG: type II secretion system protein [Planctomycetota bacterium]|nr:type II secretion system protein [Planctomycetota bacterium]
MRLHPKEHRHQRAFTLIEVAVMLTIVTISVAMFARTMASSKNLDPVATESAIAASAARTVLEEMRNHEFGELFALYNDDPNDDPGAAGTAPGPNFTVPELQSIAGDGIVGTILFPTKDGLLREDAVDQELGTPRDLNADGVVDGNSRASDYMLLPIRIRLQWIAKNSRNAVRKFEMFTMYARI